MSTPLPLLNDSNKHTGFLDYERQIQRSFRESKLSLAPTYFRKYNNIHVNSKRTFLEHEIPEPIATDAVGGADVISFEFNDEQFGANQGEWDEANSRFDTVLRKHVDEGVIDWVCKSETIFGKMAELRKWANFDAKFQIGILVAKINALNQGTKSIVAHKDDTQSLLSSLTRLGHNKGADQAVVGAFAETVASTFRNSCVDPNLRDKFYTMTTFEEMAEKIMSIQQDAETAALQQGKTIVTGDGRAHRVVEEETDVAVLTKEVAFLRKAMAALQTKTEVATQGGGGGGRRVGCDVFLAHVPGSATSEDIRALFQPYGVVSAVVNHSSPGPTGIGFVILEDSGKADKISRAVGALNGLEWKGGKLVVKVSKDNKAGSIYSSHLSHTHTEVALSAKRVLDVNIDSGTTKSIVTDVDMLSEVKQVKPTQFLTASGHVMEGPGLEGSVNGTAGGTKKLSVKGAEFIPSAADNLLSVSDLADQKLSVWFNAADLSVNIGTMDPDAKHEIVATGFRKDKQYRIEIEVEDAVTNESAHGEAGSVVDVEGEVDALACLGKGIPSKLDWGAWHERFGHVNCGAIARTVGHVHGLKIRGEVPGDFV
ncbi:hypothetical protein HDU98_005241, partial [Podochytrium sp. JEL0797]